MLPKNRRERALNVKRMRVKRMGGTMKGDFAMCDDVIERFSV
jgi:hypothetical protein